jgi:2,5-diamino-6-(ribosylamino)-4(3H)-pyrimidinone 5'-phosphate reductase
LSTRLKEKQEKIQRVITDLAEESAKGVPVVVEGKKDVDALRSLGLIGPVFTVKTGGKTFAEALLEIEASGAAEVILLLDFDRRGRQGTAHLNSDLERAKVKVNLGFWRALSALAGREIQCIEGLSSYVETLLRKTM